MKRLALIALPLVLTACVPDVFSTQPEVNIDPEKVKSTVDHRIVENPAPDARFDLKVGDTLTIRLDANPTTGIWWQDPAFDASILSAKDSQYIADPAPEGIVGSGGTTEMVFEAIGAGTSTITSEYSRGGGEIYERLDVTIEVTE